jgi:hypothetical protein
MFFCAFGAVEQQPSRVRLNKDAAFAAASVTRLPHASSTLRFLEQLKDSSQRDAQPVGPVVQFIPEFVERLLEQVNVQQYVQFIALDRKEIAFGRVFKIGVQERRAYPDIP